MGGVLTAAATIAAAVGAAAAYRYLDRRRKDAGEMWRRVRDKDHGGTVIDCERDPETGVYKPRQ